MFQSVATAPPDAILGITEAFNKDPNPRKINLSVGVYKDEAGKTPVLATVKAAEAKLLETEASKNYLPIDGSPAYGAAVQAMVLGAGHEAVVSKRCATAHTPGGTAALRVASDYLKRCHGGSAIWVSEPTWPNHPQVFAAAGLTVKTYPYFDAPRNTIAAEAMFKALEQIPAGDAVLLHACCHNPTGADPTLEQWTQIGQVLAKRGALPLVDFAYQGFADGLTQDAQPVQALVKEAGELLICSSFSKNFGLYNERVGALTVVVAQEAHAKAVMSQIKSCIRANYSNPPAHGGLVVATILGDAGLKAKWELEVTAMRQRIQGMRSLFVQTLAKVGVQRDFSFVDRQRGMFSFSGLTAAQVERLKKEHGVYIVGNGRINVAGMTPSNMEALCRAIAAVL